MTPQTRVTTRDHTFTYAWLRRGRPTSWKSRTNLMREKGGHICGAMAPSDEVRAPAPWLTLILGSGCLEEAGSDSIGPSALAGLVVARSTMADSEDTGADKMGLRRYVESLARDRAPQSAAGDGVGAVVDDDAVRMAEISLLLTTAYHEVQAMNAHAPQRGTDDVAYVTEHSPQAKTVLLDVKSRIIELTKRLEQSEMQRRAVTALLDDIGRQCDAQRIESRHLGLLAELTWISLTQSREYHPGWTDLLVRVAMEGDHSGMRPAFTALPDPEEAVRTFLEGLEADRTLGEPSNFYKSVAKLLKAQAELSREASTTGVTLPAASVFVTSFDIELERTLALSECPFSVVFPVDVSQPGGSDQSSLIWLLTDVDKLGAHADHISAVKDGTGTWSVLTSMSSLAQRGRPVVVRLAGSPLMTLPTSMELSAMSSELDVDIDDDPVTNGEQLAGLGIRLDPDDPPELHHAVTIDEYSSLQLSHAEIVAAHVGEGAQASLPADLSKGSPQSPRFWSAFGMQIEDPVIRFRVFSQVYAAVSLATHDPASSTAAGLHSPRARGLAVNRRDVEPHAPLFRWLGFDTVEGRCSEFVGDLQHYMAHIASTPPGKPVVGTNAHFGCRVERSQR